MFIYLIISNFKSFKCDDDLNCTILMQKNRSDDFFEFLHFGIKVFSPASPVLRSVLYFQLRLNGSNKNYVHLIFASDDVWSAVCWT